MNRRYPLVCPTVGVLVTLAGIGLLGGCGRTPSTNSPDAGRPDAQPSASNGAARPTQADLEKFLHAGVPKADGIVRLDVLADPPVASGQDAPGTWVMKAKITLTYLIDFFDSDDTGEDQAPFRALSLDCDRLTQWAERFAATRFAREHYPDFRVGTVSTPTIVRLKTPRGKSLPPIYTTFAVERQVDRWNFVPIEGGGTPPDLTTLGTPRAELPVAAVIAGSPEAAAALATNRKVVADAQAKKTEIEAAYRQMVTAGTAPGARYVGRISHPLGVVAAEVRFLPRPGGQEGAAAFMLTLPDNPGYSLEFTGAQTTELPLSADAVDLTVHNTKAVGKSGMNTVPETMIHGVPGMFSGENKTFVFTSEGAIEGNISAFNGRHHFTGTPVK